MANKAMTLVVDGWNFPLPLQVWHGKNNDKKSSAEIKRGRLGSVFFISIGIVENGESFATFCWRSCRRSFIGHRHFRSLVIVVVAAVRRSRIDDAPTFFQRTNRVVHTSFIGRSFTGTLDRRHWLILFNWWWCLARRSLFQKINPPTQIRSRQVGRNTPILLLHSTNSTTTFSNWREKMLNLSWNFHNLFF